MPKSYELDKFGKSQRYYDDYNDLDDADDITTVLNKYGSINVDFAKEHSNTGLVQNLVDYGFSVKGLNQLGVVKDFQQSVHKATLLDRLSGLVDDALYAIWDFLSWRKVKSSLTILGGIGGGIAVGALLGTFVLPGIGTLIGGAAASAIGGLLTGIGGTIGMSIIGGVVGSFFGKKISDKLFKFEKRFQPSKRFTRMIKKNFNINHDDTTNIDETIDLINAYLYNRAKSVESLTLKRYIKNLRQAFIYQANAQSVEQLIYFFIEELKSLYAENKKRPADLERQKEIENIRLVLQNLLAMKNIPLETRQALYELLNVDNKKVEQIAEDEFPRSIEQPEKTPINPDMFFSRTPTASSEPPENPLPEKLWKNVLGSLSKKGYNIKEKNDRTAFGEYHATYQMQTQNNSPLNFELTQQMKKDKMIVDIMSQHTKSISLQDEIKATVQQVSLYYEQLGEETATVTVQSSGDHAYAAQLFIALKQAGFSPELDKDEYPYESESRKQVLMQVEEFFNQQKKEEVRAVGSFFPK